MEPGEMVLSDVHMNHTDKHLLTHTANAVSRFEFKLPECEAENTEDSVKTTQEITASNCDSDLTERLVLEVDEDGDPVLNRDVWDEKTAVITIEHSMATELKDVGEQVWNGALILSDFILHNLSYFTGKVILDLGAGTGLTTIVSAMAAKKVICTDVGDKILTLAEQNIRLNTDVIPHSDVVVKELDWCQESLVKVDGRFGLTDLDITEILNCDVIIAADVIYDDDLTDALFNMIYILMSQGPPKTLFLGLEKRLVFTLNDLDVVSPAYSYFQDCVERLRHLSTDTRQYQSSQVDTDIPVYFTYNRTKELEIWKITSLIPNG